MILFFLQNRINSKIGAKVVTFGGKNSIFMGEKYNPGNYAIKEKINVGRNQYGAFYSN